MADRHGRIGMGHQKPEISISLSEDSKLNLSVGGTEPEQVSSSFRSSLLFNPTEQHSSKPLTLRRPGMRGIQSVENFTVDNFFGFDEDSEDDLQWSFSPVKMAPRLKPVVSVPFAVSSTPNLKPNFTRQETKPLRLVNRGTKTRTALMSTQTSPEVSFTLDTGSETHSFSPTVFMDENVPMQHFMKPPRRSYEPNAKLLQSHSEEEGLSEKEGCSKKRTKKSKKAKRKEETDIKKWAANVRAQFSEIDSFELCVE